MRDPDPPLRRIEDVLRVEDGAALFRRAWLPPEPERVLLVVHGFGEHSGRYEDLARWFARRGFAVHAYDQRGHGRSPGPRGHVDRFDRLLDDLGRLRDAVSGDHPGLPLALVGHSMGGLVGTAFVCARQPDIDCLVVSGPALALSPDVSPMRLRLARWLRRVWPRLALEAGLDVEALSRDPEVVRRYVEDPLVHGRISAAFAAGMMDAQDAVGRSAERVHVPMLLLHGESDALCPVEGSRSFHRALPHDRVAGSRLVTYPELRHEIFNEPERETVYRDLLDWLDARTARGPAADGRLPEGAPARAARSAGS